MKFRIVCLTAVIFLSVCSSGFVCATRVEKMEADISALQLQFNEIQKRVNNDQTQLTEMILRADRKLEELGSAQSQTNDQAAQQNVQLALDLEQSRNELAAMRGRLDVQQRSLEEMQANMQTVMGSVASSGSGNQVILPSDQEGLYKFIGAKLDAQDAQTALAGMLEFVQRYPSDERCATMLYQIALIYNATGADREAISYATKYLQQYPTGNLRSDVIYILGDSGLKTGNCTLAKQSFTRLKAENFKDSAERAKEAAACK